MASENKPHTLKLESAINIPIADQKILEALTKPGLSIAQIIKLVLTSYGNRPALGWREKRRGELAADFSFLTYDALWDQVTSLSSAFACDKHFDLKPGDMIGTMGFAGPEYVTLLLAAQYNGLPYVPLPSNAGASQLQDIFLEIRPKCVATSVEQLDKAISCAGVCEDIRAILVFDVDGDDPRHVTLIETARETLNESNPGTSLTTFAEALSRGQSQQAVEPFRPAEGDSPIVSIVYTSGSTGTPKGAVYTEKNAIVPWQSAPYAPPAIVLHYQPMSHSYGTSYTFMTLGRGGLLCFTAQSDLSTFLEDLVLIKPTDLGLVPRICELLYQRASADMPADGQHNFERLRQDLLGGRLQSAVVASAPLSPELKEFTEQLIGFPLADSYGSTEAGGISVNGVIQSPPVMSHKLVDVPELGYFTTDTPYPRGELAVKTSRLISGYYKRPELNENLVDADGFYHTGDIVEETEPGKIRFIDRRNNVLKLAQGEFVAISKLEALYSGGDPAIQQVFLYGNSSRSFLLGVVVPNNALLDASKSIEETKRELLNAIREIAAENHLNAYEIPRDIIIEKEPFTSENGLLAGVGKYLRPAFNAKYQDRLESMYAEMARHQDDALRRLKTESRTSTVEATVLNAVKISLEMNDIPDNGNVTFDEIGGDSLSALSFAMLLEDVFEITIEVGDIVHPSNTLQDLVRKIERAKSTQSSTRAAFDTIHGKDASLVHAKDLDLGHFLSPEVLSAAEMLDPAVDGEPRAVFLTGATGFLGRFVALEWLERLSKNGGTLICLGRGSDDAAAEARIREAFVSGDQVLENRFNDLSRDHLTCLAGDLSSPQLGLSNNDWESLAERVDVITHVGALVNHKLPYRQLFQPNVAGTAELITLALTKKKKRFVNISTVAAAYDSHGKPIQEESDVRASIPEFKLGDGYAVGYAASKWASEVLLREAHEKFDLPVSVFRSNMILAHRRFRGQLNLQDVFTRLLLSLALTAVAPKTFYTGASHQAHYEGLPVDFVAKSVIAISDQFRTDYQTYHLLNPHDDGISMDSFVAWIKENGFPIEYIDDYHEWLTRFETALRSLPEEMRAKTSLPILELYAEPSAAVPGTSMPARHFMKAIDATLGGIPHLDEDLLKKYLNDLLALGLIRN